MRFLITLFLLALTPQVYACSCGEIPLIDKIENSNNILIGSIVSLKDLTTIDESVRPYDSGVEVIVQVEQSLKGDNQESINLYTTYGGGDCGLGSTFVIRQRFLFFLRSERVFMCQGHVTERYFYSDEFSNFDEMLEETKRLIDAGI